MKSCHEILKIMSLYIDNELDNETKAQFEEHIKDCGDCCAELDKLKEVVGLLNSFEEVELPSDFKESLHEKLSEEKNNQKDTRSIWIARKKYLGWASSVAALLIVAFITGNRLFNRNVGLTNNKRADQTSIPNIELDSHIKERKISKSPDVTGDIEGTEREGEVFSMSDAGDAPMTDGYDENTGETNEDVNIMMSNNNNTESFYEDRMSNEVYITLNSSDYEKTVQDINKIAELCGVNTKNDSAKDYDVTVHSVNAIMMSGIEEGKNAFSDYGANVIIYNVEESKYDEFIKRLEDDYKEGIAIVDRFPEMLETKVELESRLKDIEENLKSAKESGEIDQLEGEKGITQANLDRVGEMDGYRMVIITIEEE
jgi:hypothetical protein